VAGNQVDSTVPRNVTSVYYWFYPFRCFVGISKLCWFSDRWCSSRLANDSGPIQDVILCLSKLYFNFWK